VKTALRIGLGAAAAALVSLPAGAQDPPPGEKLYADNCQACHQKEGAGIPGAFPTLAASPFVQGDPVLLTTTVLNGRGGMPAYKSDLTDQQLAEVLSYIRGVWGNKAEPITTEQVAATRAAAQAPPKPQDLLAH
jgi:mono/diheme cytochrome c family protein